MATIRCSGCANLVAFRGKSATCPACGTTLILPGPGGLLGIGESADPSMGPPEPTLVVEYGRTRAQTVYAGKKPFNPATLLIVGGAAGLVVLVLGLSGLWWWLSRPPVAVAPAPAPAPAVAPPAPVATPPVTPAPPADPTPQPQTKPVTPAPVPPPPVPEKKIIRPEKPKPREVIDDAKVSAAIRRAVAHLQTNLDGPYFTKEYIDKVGADSAPGLHALMVYAMLAAGKELQDPALDPRTPKMRAMIEKMKTNNFINHFEVYGRSLRLQALAFAKRPEDRNMIESELRWILRAGVGGAYGYEEAKPGTEKPNLRWDTSNSQYGLLGAWAASMAGLDTPPGFWAAVEQHWLSIQSAKLGGWDYPGTGNGATPAMTAAGTNALLVASDQLVNDRTLKRDPSATRTSIERGLEFLGKTENLASFRGAHYGYIAYGIERVGLASGRKFLGENDWFRFIGAMMLQDQKPDGSFPPNDVGCTDTAFCTLFLVRGRPPVMMAKLKYENEAGATGWHKYPRDLSNLAVFGSDKTERPLNWQVVDVRAGWREWLDAPVLMISGTEPPRLTSEQISDLKTYYQNGGLILTHADGGSQAFTDWAQSLAPQIVPNAQLEALPPDHPIYSVMLRPNPAPPLMGAMGPNRMAIIHSPTDISQRWLRRVSASNTQNLETGLNVFIYAAGKVLNRTRLDTPVLPAIDEPPVGTFTIAQIKHGNATDALWNPEPVSWPRAAHDLELTTRIHANVELRRPENLSPDIRFAALTSAGPISLTETEIADLRKWVEAGGTLLLDATGGRKPAADSVTSLFARLTAGAMPPPAPLLPTSPMLTGEGYADFGTPLGKVAVTDFTLGQIGGRQPPPRLAKVGKGFVLASELDLTTALLDTEIWGITGYTSRWARGFVRNVLLSVACETPLAAGPLGPPTAPPAVTPAVTPAKP